MKGLLYKDCRMNWSYFIAVILMPISYVLLAMIGNECDFLNGAAFLVTDGMLIRLLFICFNAYIVSATSSSVLMYDENKKWSYFIASTPKCAKGQVYIKYLLVFMLFITYLISNFAMELLLTSTAIFFTDITDDEVIFLSSISIFLFYVQIFFSAIELPFLFRFGVKKGGIVKTCALLGAVLLIVVYLLFGKLPGNIDELTEPFFEWIVKISNGEASDQLMFIQGIFPFAAIGSYLLSYKISCKLYMKGVETFDK